MEQQLSLPHHIGWRVPNAMFIGLSWVVNLLTWFMLAYAYPSLPATIPSHFGFSGAADASSTKTIWNVFMPAVLQLVLVALTWWLSYHPEYSNLPTGLTVNLLPEPTKGFVKKLLSHMLVMTGMVASLIMAYISLGIVRVGLGLTDRLSTWVILLLVGFLLLIIFVYTLWLVRLTRHIPKPTTTSNLSSTKTD